jgi:intracellular septation protein A
LILVCRLAIPLLGFRRVFGNALSNKVSLRQTVFGQRIALFGGLTIPLDRSFIILFYPKSFGVKRSQIVLGIGVTLCGCLLIVFRRSNIVLRDAIAVCVLLAKIILGFRITVGRCRPGGFQGKPIDSP